MTDAERKVWYALRDRRFVQFKFRRQVPVGPYVADFACFELGLLLNLMAANTLALTTTKGGIAGLRQMDSACCVSGTTKSYRTSKAL
jgi:hypothetical protein